MTNSGLPELNDATLLAVDRTRAAHDRTLLAWVRTAVSLISFGFTIYKFFEYLKSTGGVGPAGPRRFGIGMISVGLITLLLATIQYRIDINRMAARYGPQPRSLAAALGFIVGALGIFVLYLVWRHQ